MAGPLKIAAAGSTELSPPMLGIMTPQLSGLSGLLGAGEGMAVEQDSHLCDRQRTRPRTASRSFPKRPPATTLGLETERDSGLLRSAGSWDQTSDLQILISPLLPVQKPASGLRRHSIILDS